MKKFTLLSSLLVCVVLAHAQAPRFALFEEFTQASCGPCAAANPGFEANIIEANPATVRQISIHTSWPGIDPMYDYNSSQSDERVNYYNVTGVPDAFLLGVNKSSPATVTQADVDAITVQTSPLKIRVSDVDNGTDHTVTVTVESWGTPPTGSNWKLRTAIVERNIDYGSPPGTNGETHFPNVMRKMLPSTSGDPITFASQGNSVSFTYSYTEDAVWDMSEIAVVAFVQNDDDHAIANCGTSFDPDASIADPVILTHAGSVGSASSFDVNCSNNGTGPVNFSFVLTNNAPGDWTSNFVVNAITYPTSATISVGAGSNITATINVTPGSSAAIGTYTLTITNLDQPSQDPVTKSVYVFSGITDLVVNGVGAQGDGTGVTPDAWQDNFVNGLMNAQCASYGVIGGSIASRASTENSLTGVQDIYYNVGWSFPAFTDDWVASLSSLMDNGVNLFISGQDIGWDVWTDPSAYGHATAASQDFYTNYLFSEWLDDGGASNTILTAVSSDAVFGSFSNMTLLHYYGGTYFYPDQIAPAGIGTAIFNYNSSTRIGGVRADNGTFKMVYLAPGLEMLSPANANEVMKATYDWFHGITGVGSVNQAADVIGNSYPNPSDEAAYISFSKLNEQSTFVLINVLGQVMISKVVTAGTSLLKLNTANLPQGIYHYYLAENGKNTIHSLQVVH